MARGKKTGGRRPGSLNKSTVEAKAACAELVDNPVYRAALEKRLLAGELAPMLAAMLWYYAKGKPREEMSVEGKVEFSWGSR